MINPIKRTLAIVGFLFLLIIFFMRCSFRSGFFDMLDDFNETYRINPGFFAKVGFGLIFGTLAIYTYLKYKIYGTVF